MEFSKAPSVELGRIPPAPGKTAGKAREEAPGWVRAGLNVDVALQEQISWQEGWRGCFATKGINKEHKCLCSAPMELQNIQVWQCQPRMDSVPFCLGCSSVAASQLGQEHGAGAGGCRDAAL